LIRDLSKTVEASVFY